VTSDLHLRPASLPTSDEELDRLLRAEVLYPSERVLWRGRPSPRAAMRGRVVLNIAMALPFLAVVVFVAVKAGFGSQTAIYAVLFGLGLWQLARPWRFYRAASRTHYRVTDQRVLIVTIEDGVEVHPIAPGRIREVLLQRFKDGKGHVYFSMSRAGRLQVRYDRVNFPDGFWGIDDPTGAWNAVRVMRTTGLGEVAL